MFREPAVAAAREQFEREGDPAGSVPPARARRPAGEPGGRALYARQLGPRQAVLCRPVAPGRGRRRDRPRRASRVADATAPGALPGRDLGCDPRLAGCRARSPLREAPGNVIGPVESRARLNSSSGSSTTGSGPASLEQQQLVLRDMLRQRKVVASRIRARQTLRGTICASSRAGPRRRSRTSTGVGDPGRDLAPRPRRSAIVLR
jgi:hypothetical protein